VCSRGLGWFRQDIPLTVDPRGARGIVRVLDARCDWWNRFSCYPKATPDASVSTCLHVYAVESQVPPGVADKVDQRLRLRGPVREQSGALSCSAGCRAVLLAVKL
jgi:hypothetical protein